MRAHIMTVPLALLLSTLNYVSTNTDTGSASSHRTSGLSANHAFPYCRYIFMKDSPTAEKQQQQQPQEPQKLPQLAQVPLAHSGTSGARFHHHHRRRSSLRSGSSSLSPSSVFDTTAEVDSSASSLRTETRRPWKVQKFHQNNNDDSAAHRSRRQLIDNTGSGDNVDTPTFDDMFEENFENFQHQFKYSYSPPGISHPVFIGIEIVDVDLIDDAKNFFSLQINLFELWHEPRLNMTALKAFWDLNVNPIPVNEANFADCLWTPSLLFEDSSESEKLLSPTTILLAYTNRVLLRTSRHALKVRCHMNLQIYPMDRHQCHFRLRTFTDPVHKVDLRWLNDGASPNPGLLDAVENRSVVHSDSFTPSLFDISLGVVERQMHSWMNDQYTILDVEFIFERRIIHSLLTVYIPSSLVTVLSWLQFWFDVEAVPGRMSLGIMSTLTIMTQILTNYEKAGNHVTAVDIWLFVCLIMVFLALMEYAVAYTFSHYNDEDYMDSKMSCTEEVGDLEKGIARGRQLADAAAIESIERARCQLLRERNRLTEAERSDAQKANKDSCQARPLLAKQLTFAGDTADVNGQCDERELARKRVQTAIDELDLVLRLHRTLIDVNKENNTKYDSNNNATSSRVSGSGGAKKRKGGWSERLSSIRRQAKPGLKRQYSQRSGEGRSAGLSEVDYLSRYVFPISFVVFALLYWMTLFRFKLIA